MGVSEGGRSGGERRLLQLGGELRQGWEGGSSVGGS